MILYMDRRDLHDYQRASVEFIIQHQKCGLFLDLGLGKTVSTLTAIYDLIYDYCEISTVLVIAPKRVAETVWEEEAQKWDHLKCLTFSKIIGDQRERAAALKKKCQIYVISRDNLAWLSNVFHNGALPFDMIVADELSSFKNQKSRRFLALKLAQPFFKRFVGLTGTPAPNGLIDLWPQIYLMDRGERLGKTITMYRQRYFRPGATNGNVVYNYNLLPGAEEQIHKQIEDICISMKADDYLKMPMRTDNFIRLNMPEDIKKGYEKFEEEKMLELADEEGEVTAINAAAMSNKLLQYANGAVYDESHEAHIVHDLKINALKELIEDANGQPVLVAWAFRFDRDRILEELKQYNPRELKTPQDIKDWNDGKVQVMIAHPASAGHGLNLQAGGSVIVWYGLTWSLELYQQFNARLFRQGQQRPVIINHLYVAGTIDEDVIKAIKRKDKGQNSLLESIKARLDKIWMH